MSSWNNRTTILPDVWTSNLPSLYWLPNVQFVQLPPNTTNAFQPLDQGVLRCVKLNYCTLLMWSHPTRKPPSSATKHVKFILVLHAGMLTVHETEQMNRDIFRKQDFLLIIWMTKQMKATSRNCRSHLIRKHAKILWQAITVTLIMQLKQELL